MTCHMIKRLYNFREHVSLNAFILIFCIYRKQRLLSVTYILLLAIKRTEHMHGEVKVLCKACRP